MTPYQEALERLRTPDAESDIANAIAHDRKEGELGINILSRAYLQQTADVKTVLAALGWQAIATAPKDGTKILLWNPKYDYVPIGWWDVMEGETEHGGSGYFGGWFLDNDAYPVAACEEGFIGYNEDIVDGFMPTHWMPLHAPAVDGGTR